MAFNPFSILTNIRVSIDQVLGNLPPKVVKTIGSAALSLAVLVAVVLGWFSFQKGLALAGEEDQAKELDRKALFLEDIEREYNRKRKDVRWSDPSYSDSGSSSLDIERYGLEKPKMDPSSPKPELEESDTIRNSKMKDGDSRVFFPTENERPAREDLAPNDKGSDSPRLEPNTKQPSRELPAEKEESRLSRPPRKEQRPRGE
ncbi:hypothetical protein EHQ81_08980 [Leptospira selangorensis]|uniref:Uncharacterized protein n=1 Tax=Leptospira selangorensis TaxID=2484982 RepID=A0A5F2C5X2_9LEPT|nr:hypothetical protein [Leptospira selangorensis]TGM13893.1 hypothetical protein EHQ81_08980 [Leptospira selangorensis]TGM27174.1 hypothetical protein EHQ82_04040 [Leptospira selangorensis]